jgi:hypothetical protein
MTRGGLIVRRNLSYVVALNAKASSHIDVGKAVQSSSGNEGSDADERR